MREDNLLCLRKRRFIVTTDSNHALPVYPNLAHENRIAALERKVGQQAVEIDFLRGCLRGTEADEANRAWMEAVSADSGNAGRIGTAV